MQKSDTEIKNNTTYKVLAINLTKDMSNFYIEKSNTLQRKKKSILRFQLLPNSAVYSI